MGNVLNENSNGTLLFDEYEKTHPSIWDLYLQILEPAEITVGRGRRFDLSNVYVVFTSNIGGEELMTLIHLLFTSVERIVKGLTHQTFRPEFMGCIQEIQVCNKLSYEVQRKIAPLHLQCELDVSLNYHWLHHFFG